MKFKHFTQGSLLFCGIAVTTLTGFTSADQQARNTQTRVYDAPVPIHVVYARTGSENGAVIGTISATSDIFQTGTTTGTFRMIVSATGNSAFHCTFDITTPEGEINAVMNCNRNTMLGTWRIISGTGAFSDIKGGGRLDMNMGLWPRELFGLVLLN